MLDTLSGPLSAVRRALVLALLAVVPFAASASVPCVGDETSGRRLTAGIVPQLPPAVTFEAWAPVLRVIGKEIGACFDILVEPTISAFERRLFNGEFDIAYGNPYHAVLAHQRVGYEPVIVDGATLLTGIVVVRADSGITALEELEGAEIALPSPNAFGASLLTRAEFRRRGIAVVPTYVGTHSNVYRDVALGFTRAGGGVNNTLRREDADLRRNLRVLFETEGHPSHPVMVHPDRLDEIGAPLVESLLALAATPAGALLLEATQLPQPRRASFAADYAPLSALGVQDLLELTTEAE